jgi:segregation and condensation protein A
MVTAPPARPEHAPFQVHLDVFEGPFDLLLSLIRTHELDVTLVALAQVTDEFIARSRGAGMFDLGETTEFLVVAATLLDLKASRLLPVPAGEDEEDLALLEARDLLFARLLQYRAFKDAAALISALLSAESSWVPRSAALAPELAAVVPPVEVGIGPHELAALAAAALAPKALPQVNLEHIHAPQVSVREHAALVLERLQALGAASFRSLCSDCVETIEVVARFLALLDLYRDGQVRFEQLEPLADLYVRWTASSAGEPGRDPGTGAVLDAPGPGGDTGAQPAGAQPAGAGPERC